MKVNTLYCRSDQWLVNIHRYPIGFGVRGRQNTDEIHNSQIDVVWGKGGRGNSKVHTFITFSTGDPPSGMGTRAIVPKWV